MHEIPSSILEEGDPLNFESPMGASGALLAKKHAQTPRWSSCSSIQHPKYKDTYSSKPTDKQSKYR